MPSRKTNYPNAPILPRFTFLLQTHRDILAHDIAGTESSVKEDWATKPYDLVHPFNLRSKRIGEKPRRFAFHYLCDRYWYKIKIAAEMHRSAWLGQMPHILALTEPQFAEFVTYYDEYGLWLHRAYRDLLDDTVDRYLRKKVLDEVGASFVRLNTQPCGTRIPTEVWNRRTFKGMYDSWVSDFLEPTTKELAKKVQQIGAGQSGETPAPHAKSDAVAQGDGVGTTGATRKGRTRGRRPGSHTSNLAQDRTIAEQWKEASTHGNCATYAEFAAIKGINESEVRAAVDRHRGREKRMRTSR